METDRSTERPPDGGTAAMTREHFENLAVAINMGTNLPSCATPNGQAAFLFILTSVRVELIVHFKPCMTEIYIHIVARMAD